MHIIAVVAAVAAGRRDDPRNISYLAKCVTSHSMMCTRQWVADLLVVIEDPPCPAIGAVTARALNTKSTHMIRIFVALCACAGRILGTIAFDGILRRVPPRAVQPGGIASDHGRRRPLLKLVN